MTKLGDAYLSAHFIILYTFSICLNILKQNIFNQNIMADNRLKQYLQPERPQESLYKLIRQPSITFCEYTQMIYKKINKKGNCTSK